MARELEQALLQRKNIQRQLDSLSSIQEKGDIGGAIASIGALRSRRRLATQDAKIDDLTEQRRQALISQFPEEQRGIAENLAQEDLQRLLVKRLEPQDPADRRTLKDVAGRQRFQDTGGLVFPGVETPVDESIEIPAEVLEGREFRTVEQIANQNLISGNKTVAKQQFALANRLRKESEVIEKDVNDLSKRLEKSDVGGLIDSMQRLAGFANEEQDISGAGETGSLPTIFLSRKGKEVRQSVLTFANQLVKAQSGLQINESEAGRIMGELGINKNQATGKINFISGKTDDELRTGLRNAISKIGAKLKTVQSGHREESVQIFNQRLGGDYLDSLGAIEVKDFRISEKTADGKKGNQELLDVDAKLAAIEEELSSL